MKVQGQACLYLTIFLNGSQFNFLNISLLGDNGSAANISRAALSCNFVMTFSFFPHPVPQTIQQYSHDSVRMCFNVRSAWRCDVSGADIPKLADPQIDFSK